MWVVELEDFITGLDETRYEVICSSYDLVQLVDKSLHAMVILCRYYKNKDGEWERAQFLGTKYVTVDNLMSNYVTLGSSVANHIETINKDLKQYKAEKLESIIKPYIDIQGNKNAAF